MKAALLAALLAQLSVRELTHDRYLVTLSTVVSPGTEHRVGCVAGDDLAFGVCEPGDGVDGRAMSVLGGADERESQGIACRYDPKPPACPCSPRSGEEKWGPTPGLTATTEAVCVDVDRDGSRP